MAKQTFAQWKGQLEGHMEEMTDGEYVVVADLDEELEEVDLNELYEQGMTAKAAAMKILDDAGVDYDPEGGENYVHPDDADADDALDDEDGGPDGIQADEDF